MKLSSLKDFFQSLTNGRQVSTGNPDRPEWLKAYHKTRSPQHTNLICHAPFNSMYFNVHGQVAPCWLTLGKADTYPEKSLIDIWFGEKFTRLREAIKDNNLDYGCKTCKHNLECGNYVSVLSKLYDYPYPSSDYPAVMEFELSNKCNLNCIMCKGELSSTIRKNRDQLPPLEVPYDDAFVEQLKVFLPHLKEVKFLGGEPFLIDIYYKIWDVIAEVNPKIKITITTNGTVFNKKVQNVLDQLDCNIIISIDSFFKSTYEAIREGAKHERVMEHFENFRAYTQKKQNYMGVSINPLRRNWHELTQYVDFCNKKNVHLWFNTVIYPYAEALWTLSPGELQNIYQTLSGESLKEKTDHVSKEVFENNCRNYYNLVEVQIKSWSQEAENRMNEKEKLVSSFSDEEIFEVLHENLNRFIRNDAYIVDKQKKIKLNEIHSNLEKIKESGKQQSLIKELYLMPEDQALKQLNEQIRVS